jgi:hypothetical protein
MWLLLSNFFSYKYPPRFVHTRSTKFLTHNLSVTSIIPVIDNENDFHFLHRHLLNKSIITEHQVAARIATATDLIDDNLVDDALLQTRPAKNSKWINNLNFRYTDEKRSTSCRKDVHQLWKYVFTNTPVLNTKFIIGN